MKMCQRRHACGASRIRLRHPAILIIAARVLSGATKTALDFDVKHAQTVKYSGRAIAGKKT